MSYKMKRVYYSDFLLTLGNLGSSVTMSRKVLWTNPNPTSNFAAQTITVKDMSSFDYILIGVCKAASTLHNINYNMFSINSFSDLENSRISICIADSDSYFGREGHIISETSIWISDSSQHGNFYCIPYQIIGVKFTENPIQEYSTDEKVIGKWIDGKPIYRKVIEYNMTTASTSINLSSYNIDTMISQTGYNIQPGGNVTNIPFYVGSDDYAITFFRINTKVLELRCGSSYGLGTWKIILEYTKTTD